MGVSRVNVAEAKKKKHRVKSNYVVLASVFYSSCKKEKLLALTKYQYWVSHTAQSLCPTLSLALSLLSIKEHELTKIILRYSGLTTRSTTAASSPLMLLELAASAISHSNASKTAFTLTLHKHASSRHPTPRAQ